MSKPGGDPSSGISLEDVLRLTKRHPACIPRRLHEALDLALGEVFAGAAFGHCYIYCCWRLLEGLQIFHGFYPSDKVNCYNYDRRKHSSSMQDVAGQQPRTAAQHYPGKP